MDKRRNIWGIAIFIGLLINATVFIIGHYVTLPDFVAGSLLGIGIGIMFFPLLLKKLRPDC